MAKNKTLDLGSIDDEILRTAYDRNGCVLRPLPKPRDGLTQQQIDEAVLRLREKGLVHGSQREPNLTSKGILAARELVEAADAA